MARNSPKWPEMAQNYLFGTGTIGLQALGSLGHLGFGPLELCVAWALGRLCHLGRLGFGLLEFWATWALGSLVLGPLKLWNIAIATGGY